MRTSHYKVLIPQSGAVHSSDHHTSNPAKNENKKYEQGKKKGFYSYLSNALLFKVIYTIIGAAVTKSKAFVSRPISLGMVVKLCYKQTIYFSQMRFPYQLTTPFKF